MGGDTPHQRGFRRNHQCVGNDSHSREFIASFVLAAAAPFLVIFAVSLALAPWLAGGGGRVLLQFVLIAAAPWGWLSSSAGMLLFVLTDAADQSSTSESALQALNVLSSDS